MVINLLLSLKQEVGKAAQETRAADEEDEGGGERPLGEDVLTDRAVAHWLHSWAKWEGGGEVLDVLRDEWTAVQEVAAWRQPLEHSGTWAPDDPEAKRQEEELMDAFWEELQREHAPEEGGTGGAGGGECSRVFQCGCWGGDDAGTCFGLPRRRRPLW